MTRRPRPAAFLAPRLAAALLAWYDRNARSLPWRAGRTGGTKAPPDPYAVLVSEIMLQQTTVSAVAPHYVRWMEAYPTIQALAAAPEREVLRSWEGLGYYSRVRNLRSAAREIAREYGGMVPSAPELLRGLPGVGAYTAGAVASIAFGVRASAVDANVRRVLCRLAAHPATWRDRENPRRIHRFASRLVPHERPGDFNQALMDLGATVCRPRLPDCPSCPIRPWCRAARSGDPGSFTAPARRPATTRVDAALAIVRRRGRILVRRRTGTGLLAGMWEFPGGKIRQAEGASRRETPEEAVAREVKEETGLTVSIEEGLGVFRHAYTRFRVRLHVFLCSVKSGRLGRKDLRWVSPDGLERLPMPAANRRILRALEVRTKSVSCGVHGGRRGESGTRRSKQGIDPRASNYPSGRKKGP